MMINIIFFNFVFLISDLNKALSISQVS